jgi:hypothetical protein
MNMKWIALAGMLLASSSAPAAMKMPADFIGEWCYAELQDDEHKNTTGYQLPSWTEEGHCPRDKIFSITPYDFFDQNINCEPVKITSSEECAPSGCAHKATIVAKCGGNNKLRTFKFERYKGHLSITRQ